MKLYAAIDLHSNNNVPVVIDENDRVLFQKRLPNQLEAVKRALEPFKENLTGVAVESTFNWYWLVDGLSEAGYAMSLVNTSKVQTYSGLKHSDDQYDAYWLAHLMRLGILPTGYIYPKEERSLRDLLRKRLQLVRQRTTQLLSIQNQFWRNTGLKLSSNTIKKSKGFDDLLSEQGFQDPYIQLAIKSNYAMFESLDDQITQLEKTIKQSVRPRPEFSLLKTVSGIGDILALTILLETGDIQRFDKVGCYASYCRCVDSRRSSNDKKKGEGNRKNGNKYLAWAFIEAANFAVRFNERARKFYQKKLAKTNRCVAIKALAHKLARACYYILKNRTPFDEHKLFS